METYIKGTFKRLIFSSNDGYVVGLIKIKETDDYDLKDYIEKQFTFTGLFAELNQDEDYVFYGEVIDNPKYGFQYKVNRYEKVMPETKDGLITFLSSDIFPGIGQKTASQIVQTLGEDCLEKISNGYECLLMVPKMTSDKAIKISDQLKRYNASYETVIFLTNYGFNMKDSLKIYNHYYEDAIRVVKNNIYELIDTISSITFPKVEKIRIEKNLEVNDEHRFLSMIIYVMENACFQTGNTYLEKEMIYYAIKQFETKDFDIEKLDYYLFKLNEMGKIIIEGNKYILYNYYKSERFVSDFIYTITNQEDTIISNIEVKLEKLEMFFEINYNEEQKSAIKQAIKKGFSIITGGPGTGKTTIVKGITQLYKMTSGYSFERLKEKMVLLAPTGRAAKRMSEACEYPASTIHRYLKWNKDTGEFQHNEKNKVSAEFLIIDETSMIDIDLLANLLRALNKNVKIVFIGDYNQLESVGPGKVLKDLIESDMVNVISLKEIYRQNENSYISSLAKEVNDGELSESFLTKKDDYNFIKCEEIDVLKATSDVFKKAIQKGYDIKNVQVLAPVYKGVNGIDNLNVVLQKIFNPPANTKAEVIDGFVTYRKGDKILQLENMPDDNVYNGDIGFITEIKGSEITVNFDGNVVKYLPKDYKMIKHGYAISVHKAQGSEFDIVIMPVVDSYKMMLYKKIIYTAITRAKKSLILIGKPSSFQKAVLNKVTKERKTLLKDFLVENITRI